MCSRSSTATSYGQSDRVSEQQSTRVVAQEARGVRHEVESIDGHEPEQIATRSTGSRSSERDDARRWQSSRRRSRAGAARRSTGTAGTASRRQGAARQDQGGSASSTSSASSLTNGADADRVARRSSPPIRAPQLRDSRVRLPSMNQYMRGAVGHGSSDPLDGATRKAYGVALRALGETNPRMVVLDARHQATRPSRRRSPRSRSSRALRGVDASPSRT
jgi:transketolase